MSQDNETIRELTVELTLEVLLASSPKEYFVLSIEELEWLNAKPIGKEV